MIKRILLWLDNVLAGIEARQGWRPIPTQHELDLRRFVAMAREQSMIQCAMYGHRYDSFFDGGETCLTCGQQREQQPIALPTPSTYERNVHTLAVTLQMRPETVQVARELRQRFDEAAKALAKTGMQL